MVMDKEMNKIEKEAKDQWEAFRAQWPIATLEGMTLEKYCSKDVENSFCKALYETRHSLGDPGARPEHYGIWEFSNEPDNKFKRNTTYAWPGAFNDADSAFNNIRGKIVNIANAAANKRLDDIEKITFSPALKWKIAFMYQPSWTDWCIYPVFSEGWQRFAAGNYDKSKTRAGLQGLICERKNLFAGESCYEFYQRMLTEYNYYDLIEKNGQIILHGAPGTGKTHLALTVLAPMLTKGDRDRIKTVQFHPGYDYSDFIVGLKPKLVGEKGHEQVSFEWRSGIFKIIAEKACGALNAAAKAYNDNPHQDKTFDPLKYVLVIDEINRADLSNVFGEVFSRMERGYRYGYEVDKDGQLKKKNEEGVELPSTIVSKEGENIHESLVIPDNLYIIGTMNDIDRSVESMDFALRRRFAWRKVGANDTKKAILSKFEKKDFDKLTKAMDALNDWIRKPESRLGEAYELGAAIFAQLELYGNDEGKYDDEAYKSLWNNHLSIILREYLRGQDADGKILEKLKKKYDGKDQAEDTDGKRKSKKEKKNKTESDENEDQDDMSSLGSGSDRGEG